MFAQKFCSLVLVIAAMMFLAGSVQAGEKSLSETEKELGVTFDLTYVSKWMSKGAQAYGQQGGLFKTLDLDLWGTGFGVKITHRNATSSGYVDKQRFDYRPYYKGQLFEGQRYFTKYDISVGYEHYPGLAREKANTTFEWIFAFAWPELLPGGLVPSYKAHYEYPASGGDTYHYVTGWVHRFGLAYQVNVEPFPNAIKLTGDLAYNDGLGGKEHDWSYFTLGASTRFNLSDDLTFVPGIYHQITMEESVCNRKDVTYCSLSLKYKF